ncbi:hypothetical protein DQ04_00041020, partial [Trypanosoma grayi]|uniref:hypothetical protein n=1 Tax=Trypanosoma grayi TaxID=71804 RepID=UPI0004F4439A
PPTCVATARLGVAWARGDAEKLLVALYGTSARCSNIFFPSAGLCRWLLLDYNGCPSQFFFSASAFYGTKQLESVFLFGFYEVSTILVQRIMTSQGIHAYHS